MLPLKTFSIIGEEKLGNEEYRKIIDAQSSIYDQKRVERYFTITSRIFKKLIPKGSSVIEIGSGTGRYVIDFGKNGRHAVGIDYSKKMIEAARKNAKKESIDCRFILADAEKNIIINETFDFALLIGNWEYFNNPVAVLENVKKILKPNGTIIISTLNIYSWPLIYFLEKTGIKKLSPAFWHFNSIPSRLKKYAKKAGYKISKIFFSFYFIDKIYILTRIR